jgi:hypothetical protein
MEFSPVWTQKQNDNGEQSFCTQRFPSVFLDVDLLGILQDQIHVFIKALQQKLQ